MLQEYYLQSEDCRIVHGYLANQIQIQQGNTRQDYSNLQIEDHLDVYFRMFSKYDLDIIYLYFLTQKRQGQIKQIFNKTQPAISYDVNRICYQVDFVIRMVQKQDEFILFITDEQNGLKLMQRQLLLVFFYSTSIAKTAQILGHNQITCRTRIRKVIKKLNQLGYIQLYKFFEYILNNLNKVKKTPMK